MARPQWFIDLLKKVFPRGQILARLSHLPILRKFTVKAVKHDKLFYILNDKIIPVNHTVKKGDDMILPSKVVEHFVEKAKYRWLMNFCICREGMKCEHYPRNLGCLFMGEAVLNINPKWGKLVSKEEALAHLKKCEEAGLVHTMGRSTLDTTWLGVQPGYKLLTICNCCECCCLARYVRNSIPELKATAVKMPGAVVRVTDKCKGCGTCTDGVCIFGAISLVDHRSHIDTRECRACGRCVRKCPNHAIELRIEDDAFVQKTIDEIEKIVEIT